MDVCGGLDNLHHSVQVRRGTHAPKKEQHRWTYAEAWTTFITVFKFDVGPTRQRKSSIDGRISLFW